MLLDSCKYGTHSRKLIAGWWQAVNKNTLKTLVTGTGKAGNITRVLGGVESPENSVREGCKLAQGARKSPQALLTDWKSNMETARGRVLFLAGAAHAALVGLQSI